jgi:hypothetical protein
MDENQQKPSAIDSADAEPEDPKWYLQRMYDMTPGEAPEGRKPVGTSR